LEEKIYWIEWLLSWLLGRTNAYLSQFRGIKKLENDKNSWENCYNKFIENDGFFKLKSRTSNNC
jgi:hypothetical protein